MVKAYWKNEVIAESNKTIVVEGHHYFPKDSVKNDFLDSSDSKTHCPWKGEASYYSLKINGEVNKDAAWYYPDPSLAAKSIKDYIAFWRGVKVVEE